MHSIRSWSRISVTWGGGVVSVLSAFLIPFFFLTLNVNLNCKLDLLSQDMYTLFNITSSSQNILNKLYYSKISFCCHHSRGV